MCARNRIFDGNVELADNAMLKKKPELFYEWDFEKNNGLELDVYKITYGSKKKAWWICPDCESSYDAIVKNRVRNDSGCSYCSGKKANHTNSLAALNPKLTSQWHPTKNGGLTPHDVTSRSGERTWWLGECGHEWDATVRDADLNLGCPYCAPTNARLLIGFNDMWTTNPELASLLANPEDGYKYTQGSSKRLDWRCRNCKYIVKDKHIYDVNENGLSCPRCSDGRSYPEKFMFNMLLDLGVEFEQEKIFEWLPNKRYDFYLVEWNAIIETHGSQHRDSKNGLFHGSKDIKDILKNDALKRISALKNGIVNYIEIDCSKSNLEYVSKSIKKSGLLELLGMSAEKVEWNRYDKHSLPSMVHLASKLWNDGDAIPQIAGKLKVSDVTARKYIKKAIDARMVDYNWDGTRRMSNSQGKKIVQLSMNGEMIREWDSVKVAAIHMNAATGNTISSALSGKYKTAYGFIWVYQDEYYSHKIKDIVKNRQVRRTRSVVQLDLNGAYVTEWKSIREAERGLGKKKSSINECCRGTRQTSHGFKWMYKEDYYGKEVID